ncbi:MAG: hypothetical protein JXR76_29155 [Deltaproteobacteria bacterium]|nr:hypothetical protein [Deltaproteobacteria bacterium]
MNPTLDGSCNDAVTAATAAQPAVCAQNAMPSPPVNPTCYKSCLFWDDWADIAAAAGITSSLRHIIQNLPVRIKPPDSVPKAVTR